MKILVESWSNFLDLNDILSEAAIRVLRWPITATAITKRDTVNKEIVINKESSVLI